MLVPLLPAKTLGIKCFSSWASAIKNASSPHVALGLFSQMHRQAIPLDSFSIVFTLKSCLPLHNSSISIIRHLHSHIIKAGIHTNIYVATSLLHCYVSTSFLDACLLFDKMPERNTITWNTMITGYARSGNINKARAIFEEMPTRNVPSWSSMISTYIDSRNWDEGFSLFREMMTTGELKPDRVTIGTVLSGCTQLGTLGLLVGKSVHGYSMKNGLEMDVKIGTILVDMYAKCGYLKNARQVFDLMQEKNVVTWTAVICGMAQHGFSQEALTLFKMMEEANVRPNELTFTGILNACAHSGLLEEGRKYFRMIEEYGLEHRIQHYGCMIDLFCKAGLLEKAYEVIEAKKLENDVVIWGSFLSACKEHKQFDMAERVIEKVLRVIKPEINGGVYTLISDLYALNGKWDDAERVRKLMLSRSVRKSRGSSFIRSGL
ncbi:pentatricopeptide repeat-containing protein At1g33350-like [Euphorbia lathyris]|uniref:pentatricopeptide repeat-containing protein At1g33350-like n=1 Tax=Euphorbia lathyris TaxID=212925 RepID=UPI003313B244